MKRFLLSFMIVATAMTMLVTEAEARRFGGGFRSFGRTSTFRSYRPTQKATAPRTAKKTTTSKTTTPRRSRFGGMFGGLLLGMGLGALLGHFGISGGLASMISTLLMFGLIGFGIMFLFRMMSRKQMASQSQNQQHYKNHDPYERGYSNFDVPEIGSDIERGGTSSAYVNDEVADAPPGVPKDFDTEAFLRSAKTYFIRLQVAWDSANIIDIREYTTPEMFGELRMQLHERGDAENHTDVVTLEAELLGMENIGNDEQMASVVFSGTIREEKNGPAEPFSEVWNLTRPLSGSGGWIVAGIQQTS